MIRLLLPTTFLQGTASQDAKAALAETPRELAALPSGWCGGSGGARLIYPEALNHHAFLLGVIGRLDEALRRRELDIERDPRSGRSRRSLGHTLYLARRYEDAATHLRLAVEIDDADLQAWQLLGDTLAALRRESEAVEAWRRALHLAGNDELADLLSRTYQVDGFDAAVGAVARLRAATLEAMLERGSYLPAYEIARLHLRAGDRQRALAWAVRAFDERNRFALDMLSDPVFDPLRDDPRFREAVASLGLPEEWMDGIAQDDRPAARPAGGHSPSGTLTMRPVNASLTNSSLRDGSWAKPAGLTRP